MKVSKHLALYEGANDQHVADDSIIVQDALENARHIVHEAKTVYEPAIFPEEQK